ncbi:MAG: hypothetical protein J6B80_04920 [Clostridia bacterium]|nr:hypothetical protein [Clostridia bacterium]
MSLNLKIKVAPKAIFSEYKNGTEYKNSIGDKGIAEQSKINERFYVGDHWHGVQSGNYRPLVRRPLIKRVADYKISTIASAPIAVNYSADGVPDNTGLRDRANELSKALKEGKEFETAIADDVEISTIMSIMSDYFRTTGERVKFDAKKEMLLRNAYIAGTGIAYTFWDSDIRTGLYADEKRQVPINGDIDFEILNIENVVFGDPNCQDIQKQPFIIISQRLQVEDVRREAKRNRRRAEEIENIIPDGADEYQVNAGTLGENEPTDSKRVTVLTKFYKAWKNDGSGYRIMCTKVTEKATVRAPWDTGTTLYPFAKMVWNTRNSCIYGDSEITYQIPNQIALNRATSAEIWALMQSGMPKTLVNADIVQQEITNNPGEIIKVYGTTEDVAGAIRHISPPAFAGQLINALNDHANNMLTDNGATDAALGTLKPDNAAAIIQSREASMQPMQIYQNNFYSCIEDIARIWADMWLHNYGNRRIRIEDKDGVYYVPFNAKRYENLLISVRVDVGSSPLWNVPTTIATLDALYANDMLDKIQYLERLPDGIIPDKTGLLNDIKAAMQAPAPVPTPTDDGSDVVVPPNMPPQMPAQELIPEEY